MQTLAIAAAGMTAAANRLNASAQRVASWEAREQDADLAQETVEQRSVLIEYKANAQVVKVADQMSGALLNIKV